MLRTCEYVKRDFTDAGMIKLNILRWRDYPVLFNGTNVITRMLIRQRQESQPLRERERETSRCYTVGFENGTKSHEETNEGGTRKLETQREILL